MGIFTIWEKNSKGWMPEEMVQGDHAAAEKALESWAEDFVEAYGRAPVWGEDYYLTEDVEHHLDIEPILARFRNEQASLPENNPANAPKAATPPHARP